MFHYWFNLILDVFSYFIPLFQQVLEGEVGDCVFDDAPTDFDDGFGEGTHSEMS